jgi:hypothetical protein
MSRRRQKKRSQKHEPRRRKGGRLRWAAALLVGVAILCTGLAAGLFLSGLISGTSGPRPKTAAIVDQLSLTFPNPTFVQTATSMLEQAGYEVDYYPGEEVTVDLYRNLPTHGYGLIVLRVHSGLTRELAGEEATQKEYVSLFTGEPFSEEQHHQEILGGQVGAASYYEGGPQVFGISPKFIKSSMNGRFDDTTVILMGCDGLKSYETAEAFIERGAIAFASWSGPVSAAHTDAATERLLQHLLIDGLTIQEAVTRTAAEVGPDPEHDSVLRLYPYEEPVSATP